MVRSGRPLGSQLGNSVMRISAGMAQCDGREDGPGVSCWVRDNGRKGGLGKN